VLWLLAATPSAAAFLEVDLDSPGDAKITRDTVGGLDWLDVTETLGVSMNDVLAGSGGWVSGGWRYATLDDVCEMLTRLFDTAPTQLPCTFFVGTFLVHDASEFFQLFGTGDTGSEPGCAPLHLTQAYFMDDNPSVPFQGLAVVGGAVPPPCPSFPTSASATPDSADPTNPNGLFGTYGSFLVRDSPAPVPATNGFGSTALSLALISGALASRMGAARRQRPLVCPASVDTPLGT